MPLIETLPSGLTLIIEEMPHVESVAYELQIPGGIVLDPEERVGASLILAEITSRGAGTLDSRGISEAFEGCGIRHSESAGADRFYYRGLLLGSHIEEAMRLVAEMFFAPTFPAPELGSIKSTLLQEIATIPDDPARRVMIELARSYYPPPFSRPMHGDRDAIERCSIGDLEQLWHRRFGLRGGILSIAGALNPEEVRALVLRLFEGRDRGVQESVIPEMGEFPAPVRRHIQSEGAQVQIAMAYPSARFGDQDYYVAKVATGILSGGMFGRLFIEVREKRGLCYSIYARHGANDRYGQVALYAGTTPERAHETLAVMTGELNRLAGTVTQDELDRARVNLLTGLIMGEESTASRATSNASDWWLQKRIRSLDEITQGIERVSIADIDRYVARFPAHPATIVTLGASDAVRA